MQKAVKQRILFTALSIVVAFFFSEYILRLVGYTPLNRHTIDTNNLITFKPNKSFIAKDRCYTSILRTNSLGFHSENYPLTKPEKTFRIAVVGDSFVESSQVPVEQTFFHLLEKKLNDSSTGIHFEVIGIGKSGHGAILNTLFTREYALQYQPDLVIGTFITNDPEEDVRDSEKFKALQTGERYSFESLQIPKQNLNKKVEFVKDYILEESHLLERWLMNFLVIKNNLEKKEISSLANINEQKSSLVTEILVHPTSTTSQEAWKKEELALNTFHDFVTEKNTKFLLVHLAEGFLIEPELQKELDGYSPTEKFYERAPLEHLQSIAAKNNFAFFQHKIIYKRSTTVQKFYQFSLVINTLMPQAMNGWPKPFLNISKHRHFCHKIE